jgi:S-DNA-T family DNA segregation ATPase FtsK/SpoIIIE
VKLTIVDGKNSPRLGASSGWSRTATSAASSRTPRQRPDRAFPRRCCEIKRHIEQVNDFLSSLPVTECPEGKLTREISRKYPQARVWMLVIEEFQLYFETDDQDTNKEIAGLLSFIMAVGPSAGVIVIGASQKPSGVGAGDVSRLFNRFRDNFAVRFALKCGNRIVSDGDPRRRRLRRGLRRLQLPIGLEYRGVGYLYGARRDPDGAYVHG